MYIYYCCEAGSLYYWLVCSTPIWKCFYQHTKLTSAQYKRRVIFTLDSQHGVIFTLDDRITYWTDTSNQHFEAQFFLCVRRCDILNQDTFFENNNSRSFFIAYLQTSANKGSNLRFIEKTNSKALHPTSNSKGSDNAILCESFLM